MDPIPIDDEVIEAAVLGIIVRWNAAFVEKKELDAEIDKMAARGKALLSIINHCRTALLAFGFDVNQKGVMEELGQKYAGRANKIVDAARQREAVRKVTSSSDVQEILKELEPTKEPDVEIEPPSVREFVLSYLRASGPTGAKARTIRGNYEHTYGKELHPKTIGMTLFRLSEKGLVRRAGQTWFFVPQTELIMKASEVTETKNPGVGAPGHSNVLD